MQLSKYEKVRVLGARAFQLSMGAPPLVDISGLNDAVSIAEKELREGKLPLIIRRTFPDGTIKEIDVNICK